MGGVTIHIAGRTLGFAGAARLDNATALARAYGLPVDASETLIIGHAYCRHGVDFPASLLGDFSFALHDPAEGALWLVRDHLGVRPLYYYHSVRCCVASNSLDAMLADPAIPQALSDGVVADWCLSGRLYAQSETFFAAIRKVPRATALRLSATGVSHHSYWPLAAGELLVYRDERDYLLHLQALLRQVVLDRLPKQGLVAAHFSGGLDSTPIAILAGRACLQQGRPFFSYNWCRPDGGDASACSEWDDARNAARAEGFGHQEFGITADALKVSLLHHDVARDGTTMFEYERAVLAQAREAGVGWIFSGFGGDELLSCSMSDSLASLIRQGRCLHAWQRLALQADPQQSLGLLRRLVRFGRLLRDAAGLASEKPHPWLARREEDQRLRRALLNPGPAACWGGGHCLEPPLQTVRDFQRYMLESGYHQERMESWAILGGRVGVQYLYPYLDKRIVEFALALPPEWYFRHGQNRYLYRKAAANAIPAFMRQKGKPPETYRVRQLVRERLKALVDPEVHEMIRNTDSPYINTQALLAQCRQIHTLRTDDLQVCIPQVQALTGAVLTLNIGRKR